MTEIARVADGLSLRRDLLEYLCSGGDELLEERLRMRSPAAWDLVLRAECCALPLAAHLRRRGLLSRLQRETAFRIESAEASELQRVLAARGLIRELDEIGVECGIRFVILKGGARAVRRDLQPLDLGDVDALAPTGSATAAWSALASRGWAPTIVGMTPGSGSGSRIHFAPLRSSRHALHLELHDRFSYGASSVADEFNRTPLDGCRSLDRLTGPSAFLTTLIHSVVKHPIRRGHLRDLFLLSDALSELDADELGHVRKGISADAYSEELGEMLEQARALAEGDRIIESPRGSAIVAWKYALLVGSSRLLSIQLPGWSSITHIPLERGPIRRSAYRCELRTALAAVAPDSSVALHPWLRSPLVRWLRLPRIVRGSYRVSLLAALLGSAHMIRRHVHALVDEARGR